jgi:3-hydroxyisobutyrate dehydrogenase
MGMAGVNENSPSLVRAMGEVSSGNPRSSMNLPSVAFLGLGIMGGGMTRRLLGAGVPLTVFNRSRAKAEALSGARVAATPREAAAGADVVIGMVADDSASREIWLGEDGALAGARRGTVLVEASTLTVEWVRQLASAAQERGCEFIDAPVTGSKLQAASGELNFYVGGSAAALEKVRPVLTPMSRTISHLGPTGSGALLKLINNYLCAVQVASFGEALALIEHSELDRTRALAVLMEGAAASPLAKTVVARMTAPDFTPNFMLKLMTKDIGYAIKEAGARGRHLATAATALGIFQRAVGAGYGDQDMAAIVEPMRKAGS